MKRKAALDEEFKELQNAKNELNGLQDTQSEIDSNTVRNNINKIIDQYHIESSSEKKNELLRMVLKDVIVNMLPFHTECSMSLISVQIKLYLL